MELRGRLVVVTGASSGLGGAIAHRLATVEQADVLLVARRRDRLEALAAELNAARPGAASVCVADLSRSDGVAAVMRAVRTLLASFDDPRPLGLVNNAGVTWYGPVGTMPQERLRALLDLNVTGTVALTHAFLNASDVFSGGVNGGSAGVPLAILTITSLAAYLPVPYQSAYAASKHALRGFFESLRFEIAAAGRGVVLSMCAPGGIRTEMVEQSGLVDRFAASGRAGERAFADPGAIARIAIRGWSRERSVVIPGAANRIAVAAARWLPKALVGRIAERIYR